MAIYNIKSHYYIWVGKLNRIRKHIFLRLLSKLLCNFLKATKLLFLKKDKHWLLTRHVLAWFYLRFLGNFLGFVYKFFNNKNQFS